MNDGLCKHACSCEEIRALRAEVEKVTLERNGACVLLKESTRREALLEAQVERLRAANDRLVIESVNDAAKEEVERPRSRVIELSEADERRKLDAEAEVERLRAWQYAVANGIGYCNHAEGQGGYEVADAETIVVAWKRRERLYDEAHEVAQAQREACELYLRTKAEEIMDDGGDRELAIALHRAADRVEDTRLVTDEEEKP